MSRANVTVTFSGDASRLEAAHNRLLTEQQKLLDKYNGLAKTSKKLSEDEIAALKKKAEEEKAFQELQKKATKIIADTATAHEKHSAQVKESNEMRQKGLLTQDQYNRRLAVLQQELRDATGETARLKAAEVEEERAKTKATATTQRYMTALEKLEAEVRDVREQHSKGLVDEETLNRAEKKLDDLKSGVQDGLQAPVESLKQYALGLGGISTAVMGIKAVWQQVVEEQQKGLEALKGPQDAERELLQVSDDAKEFRKLRGEADQLSADTGVDRKVTRGLIADAKSMGFLGDAAAMARGDQAFAVEDSAAVAKKVPMLFGNKVGALESVSMLARESELSDAKFNELSQALPTAAGGAAVAGATPEETVAALGVLTSNFKNANVAADRIATFLTKVGIDKGSEDEEYDDKLKREKERADRAQKEFRRKQEHVTDLEEKLKSGKGTREGKAAIQKQLERAKRDVAEFDQEKLKVVEPERTKPTRETLKGKGLIGAVEALDAMTEEQRATFLKDDQETNIAYKVLSDELAKIKERTKLQAQERQEFAAGKGAFREKVAIADADPEKQALREEAKAQRRLEITQATEKGVEGAIASGASATAEAEMLKNDDLITRTVGSAVAPRAAAAGASVGLNQDQASGLAQGTSKLGADAITSVSNPIALAVNALAEAASVFSKAASTSKAAADKTDAAAAKMNRPASNSNAARAQAARAN